jgi:ABC-type uncharacterized transport system substrate-binding protein
MPHLGDDFGQGGNDDHSHCIHDREPSRQSWLRSQPQSSRRQCHGGELSSRSLVPKRLELASQLAAPNATIGFLGRPTEPRYAADRKEVEAAGAALGRKVLFLEVAGANDLEPAFATASRQHVGVLVMPADPFFNGHRNEIVALAAHHAVPTFYELRDFVTAGGLISYGASRPTPGPSASAANEIFVP